MLRQMLLVLTFILSVSVASSHIFECIRCLEQSRVFLKALSPHSPIPFQCINKSSDISLGVIVIGRACNKWQCMHLNRDSKRVYNKTTLCTERLPCVPEHHSSGGKVIFSLSLLHLIFWLI